jgi:hypothetical protein
MKKIAIFLVLIVILSSTVIFINLGKNDSQDSQKIDSDGDGVYDKIDAFPFDDAASIDTDGDGYPDSWNSGKNQDDSNTNLSIDHFKYDPAASLDTDYDGYPDNWNPGKDQGDSTSIPPLELDEFPEDPNAHKDTDKDGFADYYDINDLVNLSLDVKLLKFKVTRKVDFIRWAQVYFEVYIDGKKTIINNNGRNWNVWLNQVKTVSHESIKYDIPDNTKKEFTTIEIIMMDNDFLGNDDVIDINADIRENTLILKFDHVTNTISEDGITWGTQGKLWYDIIPAESNIPDIETYNRTYRWNYNNKYWKFSKEIPVDLYETYVGYTIRRNPQTDNEMRKYVTSDDEIIKEISNKLSDLAEKENYNSAKTVNFILRFVQENIKYVYDNVSKGPKEYWRFPIETLVDKQGDCEDTSVLFASIMDVLNYDVVLLLYSWKENGQKLGHLAVGIHLEGNHGSYIQDENGKKYYFCETTTVSYVVGQLPPTPPEIHDDPERIIHI